MDRMRKTLVALAAVGLLGVSSLGAADWPQWGGSDARCMASPEKNLPDTFVPGDKNPDGSGIDLATTKNVRWTVKLGSETYTCPIVANGRVLMCTNDCSLNDPRFECIGGGLMMCLDETTGKLQWQLHVPRLTGQAKKYSKFNAPTYDLGICSSPAIEGDRVYLATNRGEVLCIDMAGLWNGNQGFQDESTFIVTHREKPPALNPTDADILWRFEMLKEFDIFPHDANSSSVLLHGDFLYACTANGIDDNGPPKPDAPSIFALEKKTGKLAAVDDMKITRNTFHGQWSSPSVAKIGGKELIFYGGGDGVCYAFEALTEMPKTPGVLKCVWHCDCLPPEYRFRDGKPIDYWKGDAREATSDNKNDGKYIGPSEIIGTPAVYKDRVYVAIGQDPEHGSGRGMLTCIDATKSGDITKTGKIWTYDGLQRTLCTTAISNGLVFIADVVGTLHCLDADTGKCYWTHPTKQEVWTSLLTADGKVYLGTKKSFWVFSAAKEKKVIGQVRLGTPIWSPAVAANGSLYVASQKYLWAAALPKQESPTAPKP